MMRPSDQLSDHAAGVCRRRKYREAKQGFTLIELLAVLAISAVLVGVLLPALARGKVAARAAACSSGLHQLAVASHAYVDENEGCLPPGAANFRRNLDRWHGTRPTVYDTFEPMGGPLSPFLGPEGAVRRCPEFREPAPSQEGFESGSGGYGYNEVYLGVTLDGTDDRVGVRLSAVNRPGGTVMFADAAFGQPGSEPWLIEYSFAEPPTQRVPPDYPLDPSIHFRHRQRAQIAWVDGRVDGKAMTFTRGNTYGVTESQMRVLGVGWFGAKEQGNEWFDIQ